MEIDTTFFPIYISIFLIGAGAVLYVHLKERGKQKRKREKTFNSIEERMILLSLLIQEITIQANSLRGVIGEERYTKLITTIKMIESGLFEKTKMEIDNEK